MSSKDIKKYEKKHKKILDKNDIKKHRLLVCLGCSSSENKKSTFWNRDINACVNMLNLTKEWINNKKRNPLFCRKHILNTNTNSNQI
jgi:predicted metal-binding protein